MLCGLRMIDFPENEERSQRVSGSAQLLPPMHRPNNCPQHIHSRATHESD
jgi:hypothetical protein